MTGPKLDYTISLGNVLTVAALIVSVVVAWGKLDARAAALENRFETFEMGARDREVRIRALELGATRTDEKLLAILATLGRIETALEERAP